MKRLRWLISACMGTGLLLASSAGAAVTIGPDPLPKRTGVVSHGGATVFVNSVVPGATLTAPTDGVVVRWRARRGSGGGGMPADTIRLRILRSTGLLNEFTAVGTSEPHEVPGASSDPVDVYEYPTRLPIAAGDTIGLGTTASAAPYRAETGAAYVIRKNAFADGETAVFEDEGPFPNDYALFNADIEPDCDGDGYGDETQDPEIPLIASCGFVPTVEPPPVNPPPRLKALRVTNRRFAVTGRKLRGVKRSTVLRYWLSEPATVAFLVRRKLIGREVGGACKRRTEANRKRRKCLLRYRYIGKFARAGEQGANGDRFAGRVRDRNGKLIRLKPGVHRVTALATDVGGAVSAPRSAWFRVAPR